MRTKVRQLSAVLALVVALSACAARAPVSLTPRGVTIWQANEAVVAIGLIQAAAIQLNTIQVCDAVMQPPSPPVCHPLLATAEKDLTIDIVADTVTAIDKVPDGWRAVGTAAIGRLNQRLTENGRRRLGPYLMALQVILQGGAR